MSNKFYDFVYWLNYRNNQKTNREEIYYFYDKIINLTKSLNLKISTPNFKNQFIAYLYEHSSFSNIKKKIEKSSLEQPDDFFYLKYESYFLELFYEMEDYFISSSFNILDSNKSYQKINFIDLIERNIEVPRQEDDNEETEEDYSDFEYY